MLTSLIAISMLAPITPSQTKSVEYVLVDTAVYSFEVPKAWTVSKESPWGQRDIKPNAGAGKLGAMTAGRTDRSWDDLYETSLYFIQREKRGTPTPYRTGKTKAGYESIRFEIVDGNGFKDRYYALMKNSKGDALALSVYIPSPAQEKEFLGHFEHMINTTKIK